jgi:hypothetical protein
MAKIKVMALAGMLVLTVLMAASVPASAAGRPVTITGHGTGTIRLDAATGAFTGQESGVSSVLGTYTVHLQGRATLAADGTVTGTGAATIVAANGDQLTGNFIVTGDGETQTVLVTITGGTGRFANATGALTVICHSGPSHQEGAVLLLEHRCTMKGTVSH